MAARLKKEATGKKERSFSGGLAQLGEHLPCKQGVESSNLLVSTTAVCSAEAEAHCADMVLYRCTFVKKYVSAGMSDLSVCHPEAAQK